MNLEGLLPIEIDHFDDTLHYTSAYKILFERITRLGQMTTEYINRTFEEDDAHAAQLKEDEYASKRTFMSEPREREKIHAKAFKRAAGIDIRKANATPVKSYS